MARPTTITPETEKAFLAAYKPDTNRTELSRQLGIPYHQVNSLVRKHFPEDVQSRQPRAKKASTAPSRPNSAQSIEVDVLARLKAAEAELRDAVVTNEENDSEELLKLLKQKAILEEKKTATAITAAAIDKLIDELNNEINLLQSPKKSVKKKTQQALSDDFEDDEDE